MKRTLKLMALLMITLPLFGVTGVSLAADKNPPSPPLQIDDAPMNPHYMCEHDGEVGHGWMMGGAGMIMQNDTLDQVGLTKEQKDKLEALNTEFQKAVIAKEAEAKILAIDLKAEMHKDTIDLVKLDDLADKISKVHGELSKLHIMHQAQLTNLLTKEQRGKVEKFMAERRQMMMEQRFKDIKGKKGPHGHRGR